MNTFDLNKLMVTEDSFGSNLPRNWEAIASRLNTEIFDRIVTAGIEDPQEAYEIASSIWEDYCNSDDEEEETAMKHGWKIDVTFPGEIKDYREFNKAYDFETGCGDYAEDQEAFDRLVSEGWIQYEDGNTVVYVDD